MPWICPEGGCHATKDQFGVHRREVRTDTIVHWFEPDDEHLENPKTYKVYTGEDSDWDPTLCDVCDSQVVWVPAEKEV